MPKQGPDVGRRLMGQEAPQRRSPEAILEELARLRETDPEARDRWSLLHDISVYQEELFVQNQSLTRARAALEETRDRFIELYDFAPSGYITLDEQGVIRQSNLTAAALIGKSKKALEGLPFLGFVAPHDRPAYLAFLRTRRRSNQPQTETEITIRSADGPRHVQFICRQRRGRDGTREFLAGLVDVTERRQIEREREQIGRERASLASRLIATQDEERLRIARNLHDDVGQQVTALRLRIEALSAGAPPDEATLARVHEMLDQLDRRLHFVASELRPAALDLGIVTALDQFVREWAATFGVPAAFHSVGIEMGMLTPRVETHLYRISQEALNNAAKHAAAGEVTVLLERRAGGVVLIVEDDGCGFDLAECRRRGDGLGLVGMRERAQIIGGRLDVETSPGRGTSIFVHVPRGAGA